MSKTKADLNITFYKEEKFKETPIGKIPEEWEVVKVGDILTLEYGKGLPERKRAPGEYPVIGSNGVVGYHNQALVKGPGVVVGRKGTIGAVTWIDNDFWPIDTSYYVKTRTTSVQLKWLFYELTYLNPARFHLADVVPGLKRELVYALKMPFPPFNEQKKIAEILSTVDEAIQKTNEIIEKTERLKKGLMQELLTKGLTLGFMFDTNIFNRILDKRLELPRSLKYYVTHLQYDEICNTPQPERRNELLKLFNKVPKELIATEGIVLGVSRLGMAKFISETDEELYNKMLARLEELDKKDGKKKSPENQARDILTALTCLKNCLTLVTEDKNLKTVAQEFQVSAITFEQFQKGEYREFKDTEIGSIPREWGVAKLENVVDIRGSKKLDIPERVAFISMDLVPDSSIYCEFEVRPKNKVSSFVYCETGDLLLAKITPCFENGKQGIVPDNIPYGFALATTEVIPIVAKSIHRLFLFYLLKYPKYRKILEYSMRGTTGRQRVPKDALTRLKIPLPSYSEQEKIAEILLTVDKRLKVERNEKSRLERIKRGLMDLLLTGKIRVRVN